MRVDWSDTLNPNPCLISQGKEDGPGGWNSEISTIHPHLPLHTLSLLLLQAVTASGLPYKYQATVTLINGTLTYIEVRCVCQMV